MGADGTATGDDPGWRPALKLAAWMLIPGAAVIRSRRPRSDESVDGLIALRALLVNFAMTLGFIGVVVGFLAGGGATASMSGQAGALLVAAVGAVTVLLARFVPRPLDCHTDATLASTYRTRFFLRLAFAQGAALCGFVAFFLTANPAMYPLGLAFAGCEHVVLAPTAARLAAEQHRLNIGGCGRSLVVALRFGGAEESDGPGSTPTRPSESTTPHPAVGRDGHVRDNAP